MAFINLESIGYAIKNKKANHQLFYNLNFSIERNDFITLVGANGVGKTTLTKLIIGAVKPDRGHIYIDNVDINKYKRYDIGKKIGYLFQNPELQLFNSTIYEELLFAYEFGDGITDKALERYNKVIKDLSLEKALHTPIKHLSEGEKQRVAIGTILMNDPQFIILDEPTVGLDFNRKKSLCDILKGIHNQGIGILLVSHDWGFIETMPGRVLELAEKGIYEKSV